MAPGFRSPLPLDGSRSYCLPGSSGQRVCGPRMFVSEVIRERLGSGSDGWVHDLDPMTRQLVGEVREEMWTEAVEASRERARSLRRDAVAVANREYRAWHDPHALTETSTRGAQLVKTYWRVGVRRTVADADLTSTAWQAGHPWSSAFISYVMREGGAGGDFRYAWAHAVYLREAIDNRIQNLSRLIKGYRLNERTVEAGDIVGKARAGSGANYDNVRRGMTTHGDIVTEVRSDHVVAIGGNVNQNVDRKELAIDGRGYLTEPEYFVVLKIEPIQPSRP